MADSSASGSVQREPSGDRLDHIEGDPPPSSLGVKDLISALPDTVIHHIFSFLPVQDIVPTSVLSKRWRFTWTSTTHLVFESGFTLVSVELDYYRPWSKLRFISMVDRVLLQSTSPTVKSFCLSGFECDEANIPKLEIWLRFVETRHVEDLRLHLTTELPFLYKLPQFLYCLGSLVRLQVIYCCFSLGRTIRWPCLKVLKIFFSKLSDDKLEGIFRGSPVLECLWLCWCWGMKNIIIDSTSVKKLVFESYEPSNVEKISAPHLLYLKVCGCHNMFRIDDVSSLVEADLQFRVRTGGPGFKGICCDFLKGLLQKLCIVSTITIGGWCLEVLSFLEMEGMPSLLSECQNLILSTEVTQWHLPGIAYMLRSSRCLEKLVIKLPSRFPPEFELDDESKECFDFDEEDFLCSRKGYFGCLAKHLKTVEIISSHDADALVSKHLLALIKLLLGGALALEKLVFKARLEVEEGSEADVRSKLLRVSRNVLSCPRASKNAEVIFNWRVFTFNMYTPDCTRLTFDVVPGGVNRMY